MDFVMALDISFSIQIISGTELHAADGQAGIHGGWIRT